eukprot:1569166-Rhodomonas_salina.1
MRVIGFAGAGSVWMEVKACAKERLSWLECDGLAGSARMKAASAAFSLLNDDFNQSVDVGKDELMDIGDLNTLEVCTALTRERESA